MHEITTGEAAIWFAVSMSSAIGTFATGWLATKLYKKHPGAIAWVPALVWLCRFLLCLRLCLNLLALPWV